MFLTNALSMLLLTFTSLLNIVKTGFQLIFFLPNISFFFSQPNLKNLELFHIVYQSTKIYWSKWNFNNNY